MNVEALIAMIPTTREERLETALKDLIAVAQTSVATPSMLAAIALDALKDQ